MYIVDLKHQHTKHSFDIETPRVSDEDNVYQFLDSPKQKIR